MIKKYRDEIVILALVLTIIGFMLGEDSVLSVSFVFVSAITIFICCGSLIIGFVKRKPGSEKNHIVSRKL